MNPIPYEETKGQYCQVVQGADGTYFLKPVKVPAHVKEERARRIRQRELMRHIQENRRRAQAINQASLLFMTVVIIFFVFVCCVFLSMQNRMNVRLSSVTSLGSQVEQLSQENDLKEQHLASEIDLSEIAEVASEKLGMTTAQPQQIIYYTSDGEDYMLQYGDIESAVEEK